MGFPRAGRFAARPRPAHGFSHVATGFVPRHPRLHRVYGFVLGLLLLLAALPLLAILTAAVFATQGWRVFYAGPRIGLDGRTYDIFKFRTLDARKARELTADRVLPEGSRIETPLGAFLRDTRLDELPQLVNVVRGDMNICGPRPVRPQIAALQRLEIPDYDVRFAVKPGLIGHTQAYMHHGTSKTLRAKYNRLLCQAPVRYRHELGMIGLVGACVLARSITKFRDVVLARVLGREAADGERALARELRLAFVDVDGMRHAVERVDRRTLTLARPTRAAAHTGGHLVMTLPSGQKREARVVLDATGEGDHAYAATTDFAHHVVSRYLWQAVVVPHRSHFWGTRILHQVQDLSRRAARLLAERPRYRTARR